MVLADSKCWVIARVVDVHEAHCLDELAVKASRTIDEVVAFALDAEVEKVHTALVEGMPVAVVA